MLKPKQTTWCTMINLSCSKEWIIFHSSSYCQVTKNHIAMGGHWGNPDFLATFGAKRTTSFVAEMSMFKDKWGASSPKIAISNWKPFFDMDPSCKIPFWVNCESWSTPWSMWSYFTKIPNSWNLSSQQNSSDRWNFVGFFVATPFLSKRKPVSFQPLLMVWPEKNPSSPTLQRWLTSQVRKLWSDFISTSPSFTPESSILVSLKSCTTLSQMNPKYFKMKKTQNKQHEDFISNCSFVTFLEVFRTNKTLWFHHPSPPKSKINKKKKHNTTKQHKLHPNSSHHLMNFDFDWHLGQRCQAVGRTGGIGDLDFSRDVERGKMGCWSWKNRLEVGS